MRRLRWSCPNGHVDVLGPSRPRRDNVCRYCLPCSQLLGRLTGRTALSLMRESEKRRESRGARHEARETARAARETAHYTVAGIDLRDVSVVPKSGRPFSFSHVTGLKIDGVAQPDLP